MRRSQAQTGFGVRLGAGATLNMNTCGGLYNLTNGIFSFVFPVLLYSNAECVLFGGEGAGTRELKITANATGSNDGSLTFSSVDESGNERTVTYDAKLATNKIYFIKLVSSGSTASNLRLYLSGSTAVDINSETTDIGFTPNAEFDLSFGEVDATKFAPVEVFGAITVWDRALTASELVEIDNAETPSGYVKNYPLLFPNIGA